jgi:carbonic anhydrase/acetyltransferase-like protein (isoleucine patch superfamily)
MKVPEESLVLGIPGKVVKKLDEEAMRRSREQWSEAYEKSKKYLKIFGPLTPLGLKR